MKKIPLGWVAIAPDGSPHPGTFYRNGAKVYITELKARAAIKIYDGDDKGWRFAPAYAELPE